MSSLARNFLFTLFGLTAGVFGLWGCGGTEPTPYIFGFDPPTFDSFRGGMTQRLRVTLSQEVKEKTYIDIDISGADQQYVSTNPASYIIVAAGSKQQELDVVAKTATAAVTVAIGFTIRNGSEPVRKFSFQILP